MVIGTKLGPYEIIAPLGVGGMGEVYRARDTRLERDVALKILPAHLADGADARARFEREAKAVAALSDPNILAIYDVGIEGEVAYAAMELLDGETLRGRLTSGALSPRKTADIAVQIANGLAAAHAKSVVHRDLKPENVFITREGRVKILDFGLAKMPSAPAAGSTDMPTAPANTAPGVVMGTCGYMAPEQVRGQAVDHRADIFAFGAVLYEMLSGARAFTGNSAVETMNAVLTADPPALTSAGHPVPPAFDRILRRCLEKHADERFQSARDLAFALQAISGVADSGSAAAGAAGGARRSTRARAYVLCGLAGAALASAAAAAFWIARPDAPTRPHRVVRFSLEIPASRRLDSFALAPDGSRLAYLATESEKSRIYVRPLDQSSDTALAGTEGAGTVFFSPDSQWIAFFTRTDIKKVPARGGDVVPIVTREHSEVGQPWGTWSPDGTIVYSAAGKGLLRIPASGGEPVRVTTPSLQEGDQLHLWPHVFDDGRSVLFTVSTAGHFDAVRVERAPLTGGARTRVLNRGARAVTLPTGHLLYADAARLVAAPFNQAASAASDRAVAVIDHLAYNGKLPLFDVSAAGDLAFARQVEPPTPELLRVDRRGRVERLETAVSGMMPSLSLSPDGARLAGHRNLASRTMAIWLIDLKRGVLTQFAGEGGNHIPVWHPDGRTLGFSSDRAGAFNLFAQAADGSGTAQRLTTTATHEDPGGWSPDGRWLVYALADPKNNTDVWLFDRTAMTSRPFRQTPADERLPAVSPDGRWLAYQCDESGRAEIFVEAFPAGGGRVQLSPDGGTEPVWSPAGRELFYRNGNRLMSVRIDTGARLSAGRPELVFEGVFDTGLTFGQPGYAVARDGQHFYFLRGSQMTVAPNRIEVVLNWIEEFKQGVAK